MLAGGSVWLKNWSEANSEYGGNPNVGRYIGIYFAFGVGSAALVVLQTLILWIFCSIEASRYVTSPQPGSRVGRFQRPA
jgi:ATP-binding cassette, subfamily C (CFTR/MRP), member 1